MSYRLNHKQVIYSGKKIALELHHLEDDDGRRIAKEVVAHPGAVVILPFLSQRSILLIRNHRYAVGQILLELPAGTMEKGEDPMNAAGRELLEETGYLAGRLKPMASFYASPGILTEKMYVFSAYDLQRKQAALEEDEEIEVVPMTFDEAIGMIQSGEIQDGKTIASLLYFRHFSAAE